MTAGVVLLGLLTAGFFLWLGFRAHSRALLGPLDFSVTKPRVAMGEKLEYTLSLNPKGTLRVNSITVVCRGYEWIQWTESESYTDSDGRSRTRSVTRTRTHTLFERSQRAASDRGLRANHPFETQGSFRIPEEGPPTVRSDNNAVRWCLQVDIDIRGLPDVSETFDFAVRPVALERRVRDHV